MSLSKIVKKAVLTSALAVGLASNVFGDTGKIEIHSGEVAVDLYQVMQRMRDQDKGTIKRNIIQNMP